ncbi:MAG: sugar ABC transporter permease [Treponema sp.]|nr:sugar ABC transporter permease [Treponema sp.]
MAKKAAKEYNVQKKETLKEYKGESKDKIKEELSKVLNEFDEHYDGCSLCKRATKKGLRTTVHRAWFRGPVVTSLAGLFTLGSKQNTTVTKYMDHSVFMMINGILCLIIIGFFVILYIFNINGTKKAVTKIIKNNKFPTWEETRNDISQNSFATLCISPAIVMIAIFSLVPLLFSALVAFTNYSSPDHIPPNNLVDWVGLSNFVQMFSMKIGGGEWAKSFVNAAIWTLVWAIFATLTCFFVGFFYAFVLQDKRVVIPKFFRTVYILPYAIPTMLSLFVWANLLNGTVGPINRTLQLLGFIEQPIPWLSNPWVAKGSLIFVNIWIGFPYSMILTTSSMTAISNSLYEAAVIDGATKWQQFKSITYPLVMFQLKPTLIMQFASNINNFGAVFFLTGGGPNLPQAGLTTATSCGSTDLLISWIYKLTMNTPSRYNLASVLSLLVFVVLVPFALYSFTRTKSFKEGEV